MELVAKNWGGYYEYLKTSLEETIEKRKTSYDPYIQIRLDDVRRIKHELMLEYVKFLDNVQTDFTRGKIFQDYLEKKVNEYSGKVYLIKVDKKKDMEMKLNETLSAQEQLHAVNLAFHKFKEFRLED